MHIEIEIEFEESCGTCYGLGMTHNAKLCEPCQGTGLIVTALGRKFLAFMRKYADRDG